jgi:hypothetical protein
MKSRFIAAVALAVGLATPAVAQTTGSTGDRSMPDTWLDGIADVFFGDTSGTNMRSEEERTTRWGRLSEEQRAQARADCQRMYPSKGQTALKPKVGADAKREGGMVTVCGWVSSQQ